MPGDLLEAGVWRGGACIFMHAILKAYGETGRRIWGADSFQGLPAPNPDKYPADSGQVFHCHTELAVSLEEVRRNFAKYGLLDDQVVFLQGWLQDSLPVAPIERLALLRIDADLYESTQPCPTPLVRPGVLAVLLWWMTTMRSSPAAKPPSLFEPPMGFLIPMQDIDGVGIFWKKCAQFGQDAG